MSRCAPKAPNQPRAHSGSLRSVQPVASLEDVLAHVREGTANRSVGCTDMNAHSSRSHLCARRGRGCGATDTQTKQYALPCSRAFVHRARARACAAWSLCGWRATSAWRGAA